MYLTLICINDLYQKKGPLCYSLKSYKLADQREKILCAASCWSSLLTNQWLIDSGLPFASSNQCQRGGQFKCFIFDDSIEGESSVAGGGPGLQNPPTFRRAAPGIHEEILHRLTYRRKKFTTTCGSLHASIYISGLKTLGVPFSGLGGQ